MHDEGNRSVNAPRTVARRRFLRESLFGGLACAFWRSNGAIVAADPIVPSILRLAPAVEGQSSPVITALAIDPSGRYAVAAGDDHAIRWFDLQGKADPYVDAVLLEPHEDWVQSLEISKDGGWLGACGKDGLLQVWRREDVQRGSWKRVHAQHVDHALFAIKFVGEHSLVAAGFSNALYRLDLDQMLWSIDHESACSDIRAIAVSNDQRALAYGGRDGAVRLLDLDRVPMVQGRKRDVVMEVQSHTNRIRAIVFSGDDTLIYSVGEDRRMIGIDRKSESIEYQLEVGAGRLMAIERLGDERYALSGSDNTIRVVEPTRTSLQGRALQVSQTTREADLVEARSALVRKLAGRCKLIGHDGTIAVLRSHGNRLYSGSFDTTIRAWNISDALMQLDEEGRFVHPVSARFENSGAQERIR